MDSIDRTVGQEPRDPYEKYRIEALQQKVTQQQEKKNEPETEKESAIVAYFLFLIRKFLDLFESKYEKLTPTEIEQIKDNLLLLRGALEMLKKQDCSTDAAYISDLSKFWRKTLIDSLRFPRASKCGALFHLTIKDIQTYPKNQEHTLGYYLSEYAGAKWLPFPLMNLIQKIHIRHLEESATSPLTRWTAELDELAMLLE